MGRTAVGGELDREPRVGRTAVRGELDGEPRVGRTAVGGELDGEPRVGRTAPFSLATNSTIHKTFSWSFHS